MMKDITINMIERKVVVRLQEGPSGGNFDLDSVATKGEAGLGDDDCGAGRGEEVVLSSSVTLIIGATFAAWRPSLPSVPPDSSKRAASWAAVSASEALESMTTALAPFVGETTLAAWIFLPPENLEGGGLPLAHPGPPIHAHRPSTCFHWFT